MVWSKTRLKAFSKAPDWSTDVTYAIKMVSKDSIGYESR